MTITRIDLGTEYLGGMAKPKAEDVGKIAVVALDSLSRPNLSYQTQTATVANDAFATTLAPHLRGVGMTVDADGNLRVRPRPRRCFLQDHFITGGVVSGTIGAYGWNILGAGTPAISKSASNGIGSASKLLLATSAAGTDRSTLCLGDVENRSIAMPSEVSILQCVTSFATHLATKQFFFGIHDDFSSNPASAASCLGFWYNSATSPNWQVLSRSGSAGTPTVSAAAVPSDTAELLTIYQPTVGTFQFYVGNTLIGSVSSGVPTDVSNVGFAIYNTTTAARNQRIGYFGLITGALTGAYDDDTFLEA